VPGTRLAAADSRYRLASKLGRFQRGRSAGLVAERRVRQGAPLVKVTLIAVTALGVAFGATTWWALESWGVAVIETKTPGGTVRSTHVWYADTNGELWLEAGTPQNAWFQDVQQNPGLILKANGRFARYIAQPVDDPSGHSRVRSLIREKYGFRDLWVGLIVDTSRSVAVRLLPEER